MNLLKIFLFSLLTLNQCRSFSLALKNTQNYPFLTSQMVNPADSLIINEREVNIIYLGNRNANDIGVKRFMDLKSYIPKVTGEVDIFFNYIYQNRYSPTLAHARINLIPNRAYVICANIISGIWIPTVGILNISASEIATQWNQTLADDIQRFCTEKDKYQEEINSAIILNKEQDRLIRMSIIGSGSK